MRLVVFALLLAPSLVFADDAVTATAPATPTAGAYPLRRIDRPRTLPAGGFQAGFGLTSDKDVELVSRADFFYAPINKLEARLSYAPLLTDGGDFQRPPVVGLRYNTYKKPSHVFIATQVDVPLNISGDMLTNATFGLPTKLKFDDTFALYCGERIMNYSWAGNGVLTFNAPVEIGMQLEDHTFVQIGTNVVSVLSSDAMPTETTTIVDKTPLLLSTYFSPTRRIDVGAQLGFTDAQEATRSLIVAVNLAIRTGL